MASRTILSRLNPKLCAKCRGRGLCGLSYCPLLALRRAYLKLEPARNTRFLFGSSPPSVFVGRTGYPSVRVAPGAPPIVGETSIYDKPEDWINLRIEDILEQRLSLVYGASTLRVDEARSPSKFLLSLQEIAISSKPVEVELVLSKPPRGGLSFSEYEPPMGPRAPLEKMYVASNPKPSRPVEKAYSDTDLKAVEAIIYLYRSGVPVSAIQRLLSLGCLGTKEKRRLVPTRWSITAVDDTVSRFLIARIKNYREIDSIEVYLRRHYDNLFIAILLPGKWSFEWMEAWWPGSTWHPGGSKEIVVEGDYEYYTGRRDYPDIGGCYYASRLAVAEHLERRRRQATAILLREIYPGFNIPIGVWFVRENIREMLRGRPILVAQDYREVLSLLDRETRLGARRWLEASRLLQRALYSRRIDEYIG